MKKPEEMFEELCELGKLPATEDCYLKDMLFKCFSQGLTSERELILEILKKKNAESDSVCDYILAIEAIEGKK